MNEYDVTRLPFTSISRENWQMLVELPPEELYEVIQAVGSYVLTGDECNCDTLLSRVVCNQLISVIDRKGQKSTNSARNLPGKKKKEEKPVEPPVQECDEDTYFEDFLQDPSMDFSYLMGDVSFFKQRKAEDLNRLYNKLGKRYTIEEIVHRLQDKWLDKMNN